jgi:hypothetical protein
VAAANPTCIYRRKGRHQTGLSIACETPGGKGKYRDLDLAASGDAAFITGERLDVRHVDD